MRLAVGGLGRYSAHDLGLLLNYEVRALSAEDLQFLMEEAMAGWALPPELRKAEAHGSEGRDSEATS